jgi:predicted transcriptional regulator
MKKYIYKLVLEDGNTFDYTIDGGIMFNAKDEAGESKASLITSAIFLECVDVDNMSEDKDIIVEAEPVDQTPVVEKSVSKKKFKRKK